MNAVFAAKKKQIVIDTCVIYTKKDSQSLIQQISHLTGGVYLQLDNPKVILNCLMSIFACDRYSRQFLPVPTQQNINFSASCFCHKQVIELGFVCSYCLSIFCHKEDQCSTCASRNN